MNAALRRLALITATLLLAGCATFGAPRSMSAGDKLDPWESWNRKVFAFNEGFDVYVLKPVATGYRDLVPGFVRTAISNFFNNAADGWSAVNLFLQGRLQDGLHDTTRFVTNSTFGLGGLLDIASEIGFEHHYEDFGQTLGKWGIGAGAYIVWPLLGSSSLRESFAMPLDRLATPAVVFHDGSSQGAITVVQTVNARAQFLGASQVIDDIALDKYTFIRDAYLARRRSLVYDGEPPSDDEDYYDDDGESSPPGPAAPASAPSPSSLQK